MRQRTQVATGRDARRSDRGWLLALALVGLVLLAAPAAAELESAHIVPERQPAEAMQEQTATDPVADGGGAAGEAASPPVTEIRALRIDASEPRVDGRLDDPVWQTAVFVSGFQQKGAKRGFPVADDTEVAFVYDDDALYIGARMHAADPAGIYAPRSQRDDAANADRLIVSLDTYRNRQTAYNFGVTAGGARIDYYQPEDVFELRDYSYDPVWEARAAVYESGWTAEMRIPFSSLEFHESATQVWGVNIQRVSPGQRMYAFWIVVPGEEVGWSSRFGDLVGISDVASPRRIADIPYVTAQNIDSELRPAADDRLRRVGGDVLYDVTPSLAFEGTVNPDFGQIEADPAVVNLTAYETFFPEKRPFFLKGSQLLQGQGPRYFYSRRIGGAPHGRVEGPFVDTPVGTTIFGAGKLIGRLPNGLSVGALLAFTDEAEARTFDPQSQAYDSVRVEPRTFFGVGRVQKDLGAGSTFGAVATGVSRSVSPGEPLSAVVPRQAYSGGADWNLRFAGGSHQFGGFLGGSIVQGEPGAILRLQGSSARYFQRPDADYVEIDPTRTSLSGYTAGMHLGRVQGPLQWSVGGEVRSPGFEINDAGAMATADDVDLYARTSYGTPLRNAPWHRVDIGVSFARGWNFGGLPQYSTPGVDVGLVWRNFWRTYISVARDGAVLSDSLTRGGPLMGTPSRWRSHFGLSSNDALQTIWGVDVSYSTDAFGSWGYDVSARLSSRFNDHLWAAIIPGVQRAWDARQYFGRLADGRPETYGQRYVFASLDRTTLYTRLRVKYDVTSNFGFELYAEPFAARGDYEDFAELAAARSDQLRVYGRDEGTTITPLEDGSYTVTDGERTFLLGNGDFDIRSFRSNLVLRWDYRQGSTLWLVWQQTRFTQAATGEPLAPFEVYDVFNAPVENVLAIKASFRFDIRR